jgi:hypothetical protein
VLQDGAGSNGTNGGNSSYTPPPANTTSAGGAKPTNGAGMLGVNVGGEIAFVIGVLGTVFML